MRKEVVAYVNTPRQIIQAFIDVYNDDLREARKITKNVFEDWLEELKGLEVSNALAEYTVQEIVEAQPVRIGDNSYQVDFWKVKFKSPESKRNIIDILDTGRKRLPKRNPDEGPYLLPRAGIGVARMGQRRDLRRMPTVTAAGSISLSSPGETKDTASYGPIRKVNPRNIYELLLERSSKRVASSGLSVDILLEIIRNT